MVMGAGSWQLDEAKRRVTDAIDRSELPEKKRRRYTRAAHKVLEALTPAGLARHLANTTSWCFYDSHAELTEAFLAKYPTARGKTKLLKGVFDRDGELHLNDGGRIAGRVTTLTEFYA